MKKKTSSFFQSPGDSAPLNTEKVEASEGSAIVFLRNNSNHGHP